MTKFEDKLLKSREFLWGAILLLLGAGSSLALIKFHIVDFGVNENKKESIGEFEPMDQGVRFRSGGSTVWQDVGKQYRKTISSGDSIFTSESSNAEVDLQSGSKLTVTPSSMVVFIKPKKNLDHNILKVESGRIKVVFKKETSSPLLVEIKGKTFQIEVPKGIITEGKGVLVEIDQNRLKGPISTKLIEMGSQSSSSHSLVSEKEIEVPIKELEAEEVLPTEVEKTAKSETHLFVPEEEIQKIRLVKKPLHHEDTLHEAVNELEQVREKVVQLKTEKNVSTNQKRSISSVVKQDGYSEKIEPIEPPGIPIEDSYSEFKIKFSQGFYRLNGIQKNNGTVGVIGSDSWRGVDVEWSPQLSENTSADFGVKYRFFEGADLSTESLQGRSQSLSDVYAGLNQQFNSRLWVGVRLGQSAKMLYRFVDATTLKIDKSNIFYGNINFKHRVFDYRLVSCFVGGYVGFNAPFSNDIYSTSTGLSYGGSFLVVQKIKGFRIFAEPYFRSDSIPSSVVDYTELELGMMFGFKFKIDSSN